MVLSFSELKASLTDVVTNCPKYFTSAQEFFTCLMNTGCRPIELIELNRWQEENTGQWKLRTAKNNYPRIIPKNALTGNVNQAIQNQWLNYWQASIRQQRFAFNRTYIYPKASIGGKEVELYLFRHYVFKKLANDGLSVTEIREIMGEHSNTITSGYINSQIIV